MIRVRDLPIVMLQGIMSARAVAGTTEPCSENLIHTESISFVP